MSDEPKVNVPACEQFKYIQDREREIRREEGREEKAEVAVDYGCYDGA